MGEKIRNNGRKSAIWKKKLAGKLRYEKQNRNAVKKIN